MKTVVVGVGNTIRGDDAIGVLSARAVAKRLKAVKASGIDVRETEQGGLHLLDLLTGYEQAVIIDSITTLNGTAGQIYHFEIHDLLGAESQYSLHSCGIPALYRLARRLGMELPRQVSVIAVEVKKNNEFTEQLTEVVLQAGAAVAEEVVRRTRVH